MSDLFTKEQRVAIAKQATTYAKTISTNFAQQQIGESCYIKGYTDATDNPDIPNTTSKPITISLKEWHYQCGDGCCDEYGRSISLNGKECENVYSGDNVEEALKFVLLELGYNVIIEEK